MQWNGEEPPRGGGSAVLEEPVAGDNPEEITLAKIVSLAAVDAVNPCALAVLTLLLVAILTYNPGKRRNVMFAGLAFSLAVFVMYLVYGLVIVRFFQAVQALTSVSLVLYTALGALAIVLGLLNIRDFFSYRPGGLGTEMPMRMRVGVKKILAGVTSPGGAFSMGILVTLFLLPCTMGPYIIAGGLLSVLDTIHAVPMLLLYNLIFVLPMIVITAAVYVSIARVDDVSGWKDKNIRRLHLAAGAVMLLLGVAMVVGWV